MSKGSRNLRIGIFGGAFDPPHLAHLSLAHVALTQLKLEQLRLFPTGQAWHKARPLSHSVHRVAMTRLAFADLPQVLVDEREVARAGPTYTIDTLQQVQREYPCATLYLILGEDQFMALHTWHRYADILHTAIICVATRANSTESGRSLDGAAAQAIEADGHVQHLLLPAMAVSSTDIRQRVASAQEITNWVPEAVARYIAQHHLYQNS